MKLTPTKQEQDTKKRYIPFWLLPSSWGLKDESRQRAYIEYRYKGETKERKLIDLKYDPEVDKSAYAHAQLKVDLRYGYIDDEEYKKQKCDIYDEPWVDVVSMSVETDDPNYGQMELDYNQAFVDYLKNNEIEGDTDEQIIENWFNMVCKNIALERYDGEGDFTERIYADNDHDHQMVERTRVNSRTIDDDGMKKEYS